MAKAKTASPGGRGGRNTPPAATPRAERSGSLVAIYQELRKVTWPTWRELTRMTQVVVATVILFAFFIGGLDLVLSYIAKPIYSQLGTTAPTALPTVAPVTLPSAAATLAPGATASPGASTSPSATTSPAASPAASPSTASPAASPAHTP